MPSLDTFVIVGLLMALVLGFHVVKFVLFREDTLGKDKNPPPGKR